MTSRQHLTPTPTVDRNGKQTTVYKKPPTVAGGASLPRPSLPVAAPAMDATTRDDMVSRLVRVFPTAKLNGDLHNAIAESLNGYSDELLVALDTMPDFAKSLVGRSVSACCSENEVREGLYLFPYLNKMNNYYIASNILKSLHCYPSLLTSDDFSRETEEVRSQARSLLLVTDAVISGISDESFVDTDPIFILKDERLVRFALDHADKADLIAGIIRERSICDVDVLTELIDTDAIALSDGML